MAHRSVRDNNPLAKPKFPFFHPAFDLQRLEGLRTPTGARIEYEEIHLMRWEWEELLDLVRAQRGEPANGRERLAKGRENGGGGSLSSPFFCPSAQSLIGHAPGSSRSGHV